MSLDRAAMAVATLALAGFVLGIGAAVAAFGTLGLAVVICPWLIVVGIIIFALGIDEARRA